MSKIFLTNIQMSTGTQIQGGILSGSRLGNGTDGAAGSGLVTVQNFTNANLPATSLSAGMIAYDSTNATLAVYSGSAWKPLATGTSSVASINGGGGALTLAGTNNQIAVSPTSNLSSGGTLTLSFPTNLTLPGLTTLTASTTSAAALNMPSGVAPTTPQAGDIWNESGVLKYKYGSTKTIATTDSTMTGAWAGTVISPAYGGTGVANNVNNTLTWAGSAASVRISLGGTTDITFPTSGTLAILGANTFTGAQTLKAGAATAGNAPLYFQSGTNLTTAVSGAMEFDGTNLYFTPASSRKTVAFTDSAMTSTHYVGTTAIALNRASASQSLTGITSIDGSAATLTTPRAIYGNNFDGSAAVTGIIASTYGGTGNGFTKFTGPTTSEKTFTLPNSSATLLYDGGALGTPSSGTLTYATGLPISTGVSGLGTGVATFLATPSSANLATVLTDETGYTSGAVAVFSISPSITTSIITASTSFDLINTGATTVNFAGAATTLNIGAASGTANFGGNVTVGGNLTVNGLLTSINSNTVTVDDKNIELASVATVTGLTATLSTGTAVVTVTSTAGLIPGQALSKTSGTGAFGPSAAILTVDSATQFTATFNHQTAGAITFSVGGATDDTANGAGITIKDASTGKTFNWVKTTTAFTSSENMDIASGKTYKIGGTDVFSSATTLATGVIYSSLTRVGLSSAGFVKTDASGNLSVDSATYLTSASSLNASNLSSGTISSTILGNSTLYVGTTSVALNRASASQALTGILSVAMPGSTSGTITLQPTAIAGTNTITLPATTGTVVTTGDTGTVTTTMIANGTILDADISSSAAIAYSKLSLAGSIMNADISGSAGIGITKLAAYTISGVSLGGTLGAITAGTGLSFGGSTYDGSAAKTLAYATGSTSQTGNTGVTDGGYYYGVQKQVATLANTASTWTVNHGITGGNAKYLTCQVYDSVTNAEVEVDIVRGTSSVTITAAANPTNNLVAVIIG